MCAYTFLLTPIYFLSYLPYPDKNDLVFFMRKHRVPLFASPSLAGKRLEAKNSVILEVVLDRKLYWNEHLEKNISEFHTAF